MPLTEPADARAERRPVESLDVGDRIANIGEIEALEHVGVFVVCTCAALTPSLASGRIEVRRGDVTFHESDDVWIVVET